MSPASEIYYSAGRHWLPQLTVSATLSIGIPNLWQSDFSLRWNFSNRRQESAVVPHAPPNPCSIGRVDRSDDNAQIPRHLRDDAPAQNTIARVDHNDESPQQSGALSMPQYLSTEPIPIDGT